jgi:hypothetical protein
MSEGEIEFEVLEHNQRNVGWFRKSADPNVSSKKYKVLKKIIK